MPDNSVLPSTASALFHRTASEQAEGRAPGLVAGVVRDGSLAWSAGRGRVGGTAPDAGTQFRIGSITKTFTAILVARLRDEGKLSLSDPFEQYVPGTPFGDRTIAQLLSHTAGTQAETSGQPWWERAPGADWAGLAETFTDDVVKHRAGRRFHYSNTGFAALGELVARLRGSSWREALRAEILEPLGLQRTTYFPEAPHADGFAVHPWADILLPEPAEDSGALAPAGQLWSTVTDLARWGAFLSGDTGDVLDSATLAELREPACVDDGPEWTAGWGLGLQLMKFKGRTLVGHGGSMPGFLAGLFVDLEDGYGAIAMANTTSGAGVGLLCFDLISCLREHEPPLPAEWIPSGSPPSGVLDLVGPWYWGTTAVVMRATGADGWLDLRPLAGRGRASRFKPVDTDQWIGLDGYYYGETLRAVRDAAGSVNHLDLATFVFTRTPYDPAAPVPGGVDPGGWR
jgi:CubicO group peptidase (beta-lactamase class C family)